MSHGPVVPVRQGNDVTLYIGGVHATDEPTVIKTLLGSCIAVCLWEPDRRAGGMNHFMLPRTSAPGTPEELSRFGVFAMDCLIGAMLKLRADRKKLVAKVFGGAHVLDVREAPDGVPRQNIEFIRAFLAAESIPQISEDVGGYQARQVHFHTATGRAFVRRVASPAAQSRITASEAGYVTTPPRYGDVTLFE